jgi:hypothetical protein
MNREQKVKVGLAAALAVITSAALAYMVTVAWAQTTGNLPTATFTSINNGNVATIAASNPSRRAIQICVATTTASVVPVNPAGMAPLTPSATVGIPIATGAAGCFIGVASINSGVGAAWQAFANGGTSNITVLEY